MTPELKQEKRRAELEENLLILAILATEMEKYGYAVKGNVNQQFKYRLEQLLGASKMFLDFVNAYVDEDALSDVGEQVSKQIIKQIRKK
jgi:hypothetical protein